MKQFTLIYLASFIFWVRAIKVCFQFLAYYIGTFWRSCSSFNPWFQMTFKSSNLFMTIFLSGALSFSRPMYMLLYLCLSFLPAYALFLRAVVWRLLVVLGLQYWFPTVFFLLSVSLLCLVNLTIIALALPPAFGLPTRWLLSMSSLFKGTSNLLLDSSITSLSVFSAFSSATSSNKNAISPTVLLQILLYHTSELWCINLSL